MSWWREQAQQAAEAKRLEEERERQAQEARRREASQKEEVRRWEAQSRWEQMKYLERELQREFLRQWLSENLKIDREVDASEVVEDGVRFRAFTVTEYEPTTGRPIPNSLGGGKNPPRFAVVMVDNCSRCNYEAESAPLRGLEHIGELLQKFEPNTKSNHTTLVHTISRGPCLASVPTNLTVPIPCGLI